MVSRQFNTHVKMIRSDGGSEFINNHFKLFCKQQGIIHQYTCPYTPPQNGTAERKHRHIIETVRSILFEANLPQSFWDDALHTAIYLINRLPTPSLHNSSPYYMLYHKQPSYNHLRIFGCLCYPWLRPYSANKLSPLSTPCIFIGYASSQKGYRCFNIKTGQVYTSRHVIFNETIFPYHSDTFNNYTQPHSPSNFIPPLTLVPTSTLSSNSQSIPSQSASVPITSQQTQPYTSSSTSSNSNQLSNPVSIPHQSIHPMQTRFKTGNLKPKTVFNLFHQTIPSDPITYAEAVKEKHWRDAMSVEFQALQTQGTWDLVPPHPNQNVLGSKWIFRTKYLADGTISRYKARLVAQGFNQEYGLDYTETFSPVAKISTVRVLLIVALHHHWPLHQLDVSNAFLHGNLTHQVFMKQPPGFKDNINPTYVCCLKKALYGLKQSPREWYSTLSTYLQSLGFDFSSSDPSLLIYNKNGVSMYFLVYVDDILLTGNCNTSIQNLLKNLSSKFTVRDLGTMSQFLGIQFIHTSYGLQLNQTRFAQTILSRAGMQNCKPISTPSQLKPSSKQTQSGAFSNPTLYRQLAGSLQYLTLTRPDISFAVNKVCQHMQNPLIIHFNDLKRLLRYIQGTLHFGISLFANSKLNLLAYVDSDWAGDSSDRKSTTGYCTFLGSSIVSWSVKKQNAVARSSTEAEYRALASAAAEVTWLRRLLQELNCTQQTATTILCDNTSAIALANNPVLHARTKHIEVDCHFIRNYIKDKTIQLHHISTKDQLADLFTKPLATSRFKLLSSKLVTSSDATV
ncbi:Retrovirus-related Pol polyprotein from transposon TNT 1-94 [Dendrobium catenatum]|uniref:Retrovirus-related Pol polyprotein from transposon TNT 1-94 n=1 Tax=Dendrobium catenatum TaxID=906689 RepID=A0A2I0WWU2_9ASPA|nr:Retrovirus-related Pol polyprotein from transposon TNT 1-94 [Dendrobium catenatum]